MTDVRGLRDLRHYVMRCSSGQVDVAQLGPHPEPGHDQCYQHGDDGQPGDDRQRAVGLVGGVADAERRPAITGQR